MLEFLKLAGELAGKPIQPAKILEHSLTEEDIDYLDQLDFENTEEQQKLINELFQTIIEVNPRLFPKTQTQETQVSTSGQASNSDGNQTK